MYPADVRRRDEEHGDRFVRRLQLERDPSPGATLGLEELRLEVVLEHALNIASRANLLALHLEEEHLPHDADLLASRAGFDISGRDLSSVFQLHRRIQAVNRDGGFIRCRERVADAAENPIEDLAIQRRTARRPWWLGG